MTKTVFPKENDFIAGEGVYFETDSFKTGLNNNVMVVGGSGSGKTRSVIMPNLLQMNGASSAIISDPKGVLYDSFKDYLENVGYAVKKIDLTHPDETSSHFNIFHFIKSEYDIFKLAHLIITTGENKYSRADPFWNEMAEVFLQSIILYVYEELPIEQRNMKKVVDVMNYYFESEKKDKLFIESIDEDFYKTGSKKRRIKSGINNENDLDATMILLEKKNPKSMAVKKYKAVKCSAADTYRSIVVSAHAKVEKYSTPALDDLMGKNDIDFADMGEKPTVCFFVCSDTDRSQDALASIFFSTALNELCDASLKFPNGRLKIPVNIILDDAAASVNIDKLPEYAAMVRSRNISLMVVVQSEGQLEKIYGDNAQTIIDNCDTYIFLGGNSLPTSESVAKRANENLYNILQLPVGEGRVFRRGHAPIKCKRFNLERFEEFKRKENNTVQQNKTNKGGGNQK